MPKTIDHYLCTTKLGAGITGKVYLAINQTNRQQVALKVLDKSKIFDNSEEAKL